MNDMKRFSGFSFNDSLCCGYQDDCVLDHRYWFGNRAGFNFGFFFSQSEVFEYTRFFGGWLLEQEAESLLH